MCNTDLEKHSPGCPPTFSNSGTLPSCGVRREITARQHKITVLDGEYFILTVVLESDTSDEPVVTRNSVAEVFCAVNPISRTLL